MDSQAHFERLPGVRFERLVPGPIDRVWQCLVNTSEIPGWYGESSIEPRPGGAVTIVGGHVRGIVTQCRPPEQLSYTWNVFNPGQDVSDYPESYLNLHLEQQGNEVKLTLKHMPVLERFEKQNAMGWNTFLDMLEATMRGETVLARAEYMKRNAAIYGVDLANLAR